MPIANASPPSDMMLIVLPVSQRPKSDPSRARGIFETTTITLRMSPKKIMIISPVRHAPISPSVATLSTAASTVGDSSNWKLSLTSGSMSGRIALRNSSIDLRTSETTVSVEPVSFLMIGRYTDFLPLTSAYP